MNDPFIADMRDLPFSLAFPRRFLDVNNCSTEHLALVPLISQLSAAPPPFHYHFVFFPSPLPFIISKGDRVDPLITCGLPHCSFAELHDPLLGSPIPPKSWVLEVASYCQSMHSPVTWATSTTYDGEGGMALDRSNCCWEFQTVKDTPPLHRLSSSTIKNKEQKKKI